MLASCSKESIYSRFRHDFYFDSHEIATQFCYIDYDREMGIVAEIEVEGKKKLIGVGRLIGDPDVETTEYAVLVTDEWQHRDLGNILTQYCIEIAKNAGIKRVVAETTRDNRPMVTVFKKLDFTVNFNEDGTVTASKNLV
jgi:acetyltransferase